MTLAEVGLGPTQTSRVSVMAQVCCGPAEASRAVSRWACTRSAVRRSVISRSAPRFGPVKKPCDGALGLGGDVDLALVQPLDQLSRRQVHHLHRVRVVEDRVGHRLPHLDAGYLGDDVVEALEVLDVQGGVDVDARVQQLLHVLPALGVSRARGVGVRQLVHQQQLRMALRGRRRGRARAASGPGIRASRGGSTSRPSRRTSVSGASVRLDVADHHVHSGGRQTLGGVQHGVGLAHAGHVAEEDLEAAPALPGFLGLEAAPEACRGRAAVVHPRRITASVSASSARFSSSTFTRGSPRHAPLPAFRVLGHQGPDHLRGQAPGPGHPLHLVLGGRRADVRIEAAGRSRDQVDRHRRGVAGVGGAQGLDARLHRGQKSRDWWDPGWSPQEAAAL